MLTFLSIYLVSYIFIYLPIKGSKQLISYSKRKIKYIRRINGKPNKNALINKNTIKRAHVSVESKTKTKKNRYIVVIEEIYGKPSYIK